MSDVLIERDDAVGRIRLNRPKALHALTHEMCIAISKALLGWRTDPSVKAVIIDHVSGRGFCAGGDILMLAHAAEHDPEEARDFFRTEYRLNHLLFTFPKPIVALIDGVTMGGGVGISLPCKYRVATENTRFAMPETAIGLFPDVGGGWYLSRLSHRVGQFLALTGARIDGAECLYLGIATHYVESRDLPALVARIIKAPSRIKGALGAASSTPPEARIVGNLQAIATFFASDRLEDILAALEADGGEWADTELATLKSKSPLSCKISLRLLADAKKRENFADEIRAEFALACNAVRNREFREGVRALLIDKGDKPRWHPSKPEQVSEAMVDAMFQPKHECDVWTPFPGA